MLKHRIEEVSRVPPHPVTGASMTRRSLRSLSGTPSKSCIVLGAAAAGGVGTHVELHKDAVHAPQNFAQCTMLNCPDIRLQSCQRSCLAKSKEVLDLRRFSKIIIVCAITECALRGNSLPSCIRKRFHRRSAWPAGQEGLSTTRFLLWLPTLLNMHTH